MNKNLKNTAIAIRLIIFFCFIVLFPESTQAQDVTITIHLRGVYESKISLIPLTGINVLKPIAIVDNVINGESTTLQVAKDNLPGEFVLRFDYKENAASTPYPSEKRIIIYNQDLHLWVHPIYCNNADSTWFQKDERENTAYSLFTCAGKIAIEKVRTGHPSVYGWMVDYFFNGYESFNIEKGIKMLEPYLNDPNCLTTKRQEINKRLKGIETLVPGATAPNIIMQDADNRPFELNAYITEKNIYSSFSGRRTAVIA